MVQVKIYGLDEKLNPKKKTFSEVIHSCVVESLKMPKDKKFHRFFPLDKESFFFPSSRSDDYTIIEIIMFEGRKLDTKKELIKNLYEKLEKELKISPNDIEIVIIESPKCNWGIRGVPGDELSLNYNVKI